MLDQALAALGGIEAFSRRADGPGQTQHRLDAAPERGANTTPTCRPPGQLCPSTPGRSPSSIFDNPCDQWQRTYANSGIAQAAKDAGAIVVNGKDESLYREVEIPGGIKLKHAQVHSWCWTATFSSTSRCFKHHSGSLMTAAMKNLMGVIWDRGAYHRTDLHQTIADFLTFKQPTLNVLDAYHPMVRNGPRGISAADVVEMPPCWRRPTSWHWTPPPRKCWGHQPADVRHVRIADQMKLGTMNLDQVEIRRFKLT